MEHYIEKLRSYLTEQKLPDESPQSILNMLYEAYNEINLMDDDKVKQDFHELYELMNGIPLREMDQIVYPVCTLCRDHERSGFIHGVQVGIRLAEELKSNMAESCTRNSLPFLLLGFHFHRKHDIILST